MTLPAVPVLTSPAPAEIDHDHAADPAPPAGPRPGPLPGPLPGNDRPFIPHVVRDPFSPPTASGTPGQGPDDWRVVHIQPWPDGVHDLAGHDPRSAYVERFWLSMLGPSTTWLLRAIAYGFEHAPDGFALDVPATAHALGLAGRIGRQGVFMRALHRLCAFDLALPVPGAGAAADGGSGEETLAVRRYVPWLSRRQVLRLPEHLREEHAEWERTRDPQTVVDGMRRRAARLALSVVQLGEDIDATERTLLHWRFHPALCREMALWAWAQVYGAPEEDPAAG